MSSVAAGQRGGALLIALVVAALASVIALAVVERGQATLARTQALLDSQRGWQYARGMELLARDLIQRAQADGSDPRRLDGRWSAPFEVPGGSVQGRVFDQAARFNLNALAQADPAERAWAQAAFERLLLQLDLDVVIARELSDWIEGAAVARPGSAGNAYYATRRPPYRMAGTPLAHPSELRWLRSVGDEAYRRLAPFVTVLPDHAARVNVNTVSAPVMAALLDDLSLADVERLLADGPWTELRGFLDHPLLRARPRPGLERRLGVTSPWFLAQARVTLDGVERDYFGLIALGGSGYDFRWFSQGVP